MSQGLGGNAYWYAGQMPIESTSQEIPFPTNNTGQPNLTGANQGASAPGQFTGCEGARRFVYATDNIWIGPTTNVTAGDGYLIPANTEREITGRGPVSFVGATGAGTSSSSSGSGAPITYGTLYWREEAL